jgi:ribonuclease HI
MGNNPYAIYVNCDGAMDYSSKNPGGVGFLITFPDSVNLEPISFSKGVYTGGNIERLEIEALIQAMKETIDVLEANRYLLRNINHVIFITDRYGLRENDKTSPFKIKEWRRNQWKNHEGKPIKNHKLLDQLDKIRKKLSDQFHVRVNIEFRPRKQNKGADKLAKAGKKEGLVNDRLAKKGEKIGKRKFDGAEIKYVKISPKEELHIRVFRKDPVQDEWEVWVELCEGPNIGEKLKIYTDNELAAKLKRMNEYSVKVKTVFTHHIHIYRTLKAIRKRTKSGPPMV